MPFAHVVPHFQVTAHSGTAGTGWRGSSVRAARSTRMVRAALEFVGAGKSGPMFEEALGTELVRVAHAASAHHPIVVAASAALTATSRIAAEALAPGVPRPVRCRGAGCASPGRSRAGS